MNIDKFLKTALFGRVFKYLDETSSTNQDAYKDEAASHGTVFAAGLQRFGRGRLGHLWYSPPNDNLYFSIVLKPEALDIGHIATMPLVIGFALVRTIEKFIPSEDVKIKWPNDIWVNDKKLCGILCEMRIDNTIIAGIGINVNIAKEDLLPELRDTATSLFMEKGEKLSREQVLAEFLNVFEPLYSTWCEVGFAPFAALVSQYDLLYGRAIEIVQTDTDKHPIHGIANGIQEDGALLVKEGQRQHQVYAGEVHVIMGERP